MNNSPKHRWTPYLLAAQLPRTPTLRKNLLDLGQGSMSSRMAFRWTTRTLSPRIRRRAALGTDYRPRRGLRQPTLVLPG